MNPEFVVKIGGRNYALKITANSMSKLQMQTGIRFLDLVGLLGEGVDSSKAKNPSQSYLNELGKTLLNRLGFLEIQALFFAGLEGGRPRGSAPFTFEDAGDLIDQAESLLEVMQPALMAFTAFMPKAMGIKPPVVQEPEKKAPTRKKTSGKTSSRRVSKSA